MKYEREYTIAKVRHNNLNEIVEVEFTNGEKMLTEEAVKLAEASRITNVTASHSSLGKSYIKSLPDKNYENNLDSLPEMK